MICRGFSTLFLNSFKFIIMFTKINCGTLFKTKISSVPRASVIAK